MPHIYDHIFEQFRIVDPDDSDRSIVEDFASRTQWLETPGCLFQRNNMVLGTRIRTEGVIKAGLFVSVILKGAGSGRARKGATRISYSDASLVVMALKEPTLWDGDAPRGAHMQAAGVAFPVASLERLGLMDEFIGLFDTRDQNVFVTSLKASPRIKAIAMEMISRWPTAGPPNCCCRRMRPRCWPAPCWRCAATRASVWYPTISVYACRRSGS